MKTQGAVLVETGKPLVLAELTVPPLKPGQVLVEIAYSGVCHTQILEARGYRGVDKFLPHCLGHEGSGRVRELGPQVRKVKVGDHVVLSWMKGSGNDVPGTVYDWDGKAVNAGAITTFGRLCVISENRMMRIASDIPLPQAALMGCAVPTGLGAVFNTARPQPGEGLAVFGVGGIGLCAVQAARLAGCEPIVAVDVRSDRLELASALGATHTIDARQSQPVDVIRTLCPGGIDFAVEASGRPEVMQQALSSVRPQGGTAVVIGNAHAGEKFSIEPRELNLGKKILGTWGGDNVPDQHFPRYFKLFLSGRLNLDALISSVYGLADINKALEDLEQGRCARPLIDMSRGGA